MPLLLLPSAAVPETDVPMMLPWTVLPVQFCRNTPGPLLPEIRLRLVGSAPPIQLPEEPSIHKPPDEAADWPLPWARVPVASVPMKLPSMKLVPPGACT